MRAKALISPGTGSFTLFPAVLGEGEASRVTECMNQGIGFPCSAAVTFAIGDQGEDDAADMLSEQLR